MFPPALLTSDFFLAYAHARVDKCLGLAASLREKLAFVEVSAYSTVLEWETEDCRLPYREYKQRIDGVSDALRAIESAMPALHRHPRLADAADGPTDLSVALREQCRAVRELVPPLLGLGLPDVTAALAPAYDKLQRKLEHVMALQHRVLIVVPILRSQFMQSPQYLEQWNAYVAKTTLREIIFLVSAFENRLLRFRVHHYLVHDDPDYPETPTP